MEGERGASTVRRLLRLWRLYAGMDLIWLTRDTRQALVIYAAETIASVAGIVATLLVAERFAGIGPWTVQQVVFMMGYAMAVEGISNTFFSYNVAHISRRIGRGQLDHMLIQPQPLWVQLVTEGFLPFSGSALLIAGLGLIGWAVHRLELAVSPGWLAAVALNLAASAVIVLSFSFIWGSLAFWAPRGAEEISSSALQIIAQLKRFPLDGLGPVLQLGLVSFVPAGLAAWLPCRYLLGQAQGAWAAGVTPLAAAVFSALAALVFRKGMAHYGRTGSQRYSALGHRG